MALTYRDKDQLLALLNIAAPVIERSIVRAQEAPIEQRKRELSEKQTLADIDYKKALASNVGKGEAPEFVPTEFAIKTGGPEMQSVAGEKGVPYKVWATQISALATQQRLRQGDVKIGESKTKERVSNLETQLKNAENAVSDSENYIAKYGYDPTLKDTVNAKKQELPLLKKRAQFLRSEAIRLSEGQAPSGITAKDLPEIESTISSTGATPDKVKIAMGVLAAAEQGAPYSAGNISFMPSRDKASDISRTEESLRNDLGLTPEQLIKIVEYYKRTGAFKQ